MIKKSEYVSKYIYWERDITFHPPYKNFVLEISIRGNEHRTDRDKDYTNQDMNNLG